MLHHTEDPSSSKTEMTEDTIMLNMPPHIAARFYRPKKINQRRRSSSSSSTSSTFVHPADRAFSRRTTFLETRKSRLAARALYAEKVRSRVNHDSHEVLSARLQALKDSLSAAQEARSALLAKTAAACASEVAKAKAVAEEVRLKREEEIQSIRDGMHDKLKSAEERRQEHLKNRKNRRSRGSSASKSPNEAEAVVRPLRNTARSAASQIDKEKLLLQSQTEAASKIQRVWRYQKNKAIVRNFTDIGLTIESVKLRSFEEASALVMDNKLLAITGDLLRLCGVLEVDGELGSVNKSCRTFLSAYLILGHPAQVLSNDGENEKALLTQSKDLLCAFESWISTTSPHNQYLGTPKLRAHLVDAYQPFSIAFSSWKERDQAELIKGMIAQFVELDILWQKVKDDSEPQVAREYHEGIKENQMMVLSRLKSLGGPKAIAALKKAIGRARRKWLKKKEDAKPRAAATTQTGHAIDDTSSVINVQDETLEDDDLSNTTYQADEKPRFMLTNRQIAHELLLDRDFKLKPREKSDMERLVEIEAKRAFYDIMREDIQNEESEKWIPSMAETVRQKLLRLVEPSTSIHQTVSSVIDIEIIDQQCRAKTYDHVPFFNLVYSILPRICSPARDEAVKALTSDSSESEDYITRLEKLLDVLELMQLDQANYILMMSAPHIIPAAIGYEQRMFAQDLNNNVYSLSNTTQWLQTAYTERVRELQSRDSEGVDHPRSRLTSKQVVNFALSNLAISLTPLDISKIPETLQLDVERLVNAQETVRTIVISSALLLTIKSLLRRDARTSWKPLKEKIVSILSPADTRSPESKAADISSFITENITHAPPTITSALTRLFPRPEDDPVVKVMLNRLRGFVQARLAAETPREKVRLGCGAADTLVSFGMAEQIAEVGVLVEGLVKMMEVNRECYSQWYEAVVMSFATRTE